MVLPFFGWFEGCGASGGWRGSGGHPADGIKRNVHSPDRYRGGSGREGNRTRDARALCPVGERIADVVPDDLCRGTAHLERKTLFGVRREFRHFLHHGQLDGLV